ncbi:MAG: hypothetical protein Q9190_007399, partial [Brigantiaea leucoxantha]
MGTPHRGTGGITSKILLSTLVKENPNIRVDDTILRSLRRDDDALIKTQKDFTVMCKDPNIKLDMVCFFEQQETKVGKIIHKKGMEVGFK